MALRSSAFDPGQFLTFMRHPQIVVSERDGQLARLLRPVAEAERWVMHEPRQAEVLTRHLHAAGPTVLVVKLSKKEPERELALLGRIAWQLPTVATIAVGDVDDAAILAGLAWDVGVDFALFPPLSRDLLPGVVTGLMRRSLL
ncbi:MAG: hypothetical protein U0746_12810 [Gemmataceae bacterium]